MNLDFSNVAHEDLIISSEGFGLLRKALIENMGIQRAKKFLFRFGHQLGHAKATELMNEYDVLEELLKEAPKIHTTLKHVSRVEVFGTTLSLKDNLNSSETDVWGIWYDSFEVGLHLKNHGIADECSCHTLSGFASAYLSTIHELDIYVYETACRSKGDENCIFQVKTREECENLHIDLSIYDTSTIKDELDVTYDKLYESKALLDKVMNYHSQLTDAILQKHDIQYILKIANKALNLPIYTTDADGHHLYSYAVKDEHLELFAKNAAYFKQVNKSSIASIQQIDLISTPIHLENSIHGTISFVYPNRFSNKDDFLFLERLSVVASLYYLNDKVRFETTERLKISFLDRLIYGEFSSDEEMLRHSQYISPPLKPPYYIASIKYSRKNTKPEPFDLYNLIFQIARLLDIYRINGLISLKDDHLIIFIYSVAEDTLLENRLRTILRELQNKSPGINYKVGISNKFYKLDELNIHIKQAEQAMYFPRNHLITSHKDLGFIGTLVGQMDHDQIKIIAKEELKGLLTDEVKDQELLYTLYIFLKNNGKLEKTTKDLSLSIGGIKYRIQKIEKILNKDLKDALTSSYLLLLIETLLILDEIQFVT